MSPVRPQPGDLIEISCIGFQHWAVYIGDGFVVHKTVPNGSSGSSSSSSGGLHISRALVKKEKLREVDPSDNWKVNNLMDGKWRPRDAKVIVKEALVLVGTQPLYNLLTNNCEHFATDLRYGKSLSRQAVLGFLRVATTLVTASIAVVSSGGTAVAVAVGGIGLLGVEAYKRVFDLFFGPPNQNRNR